MSPPALGALVGLVLGIVDWLILLTDFGGSREGLYYLPWSACLSVVATSALLCAIAGLLFSSRVLGRLRAVFIGCSGLGILLLSRVRTPLKLLGLSRTAAIVVCVVVAVFLSLILLRAPLAPLRFRMWWTIGLSLGAAFLVASAWDVPLLNGGVPGSSTGERTEPSVALIFLDTVRQDDALRAMPNLRAFASRATTFEEAWAPAPWTVPSHLAVLTGTDPWKFSTDTSTPRLAERFSARHYRTAAIAANPLLGRPDFFPGYDSFHYSRRSGVCRSALGELLYRWSNHGGPQRPCGWFTASEVTSRALSFVNSAPGPYFLTVNYMDAHYPYAVRPACSPYRGVSSQGLDRYHQLFSDGGTNDALSERVHQQYQAALTCMDLSLGVLLGALEHNPNTIVAVIGDHGEQFGEHGLTEHGNSIYRQVLHVPLMIRWPGSPAMHIAAPVSITDVYWSILKERPLISDAANRRAVIATFDAWVGARHDAARGVKSGRYHYIVDRTGRETLFDDVADPGEERPLPLTGPGAGIANALRQQLPETVASRRINEFRSLGYLR